MKTEQEQIGKMARSMCGYCSTDGKCAVSKNWREPDICANVDTEHCLYKEYAERLIESGYGDVSEYKAEIERLKAENDSLNKKISELEQDLIHADENVFYRECDVKLAEDKIKKQAKIDILNKVKEKLDSAPNGWAYTGYIDDLIEEVENEN